MLCRHRLMFMRASILSFFLFGQITNAQVSFEVALVKLAAPGQNIGNIYQGGPGTADPGRFMASNVALQGLLMHAFGVKTDQISSPDWTRMVRLDIAAKVPEGTTKEQLNLMLQNLLAERFHLAYHTLKKEFLAYHLTVAKNGPKLKPSGLASSGPGMRINASCQGDHLTANGRDAAGVAQALESAVGARVVDKTGLTGTYDVELYFGIDRSGGGGVMNCQGVALDAPTALEAIEKQLGLKLEKTSAMLRPRIRRLGECRPPVKA
jgi:uncharacterized protein (TIGR03435 family)